jgi:alpha-tubulin suppressor-like RCC1 family protein
MKLNIGCPKTQLSKIRRPGWIMGGAAMKGRRVIFGASICLVVLCSTILPALMINTAPVTAQGQATLVVAAYTTVHAGNYLPAESDVGEWTDIIQVAAGLHTVGLKSDGTVVAVGDNEYGQCDVGNWTDIIQVAAGGGNTVGLRSDGTVVAVGYNYSGECDVGGWANITQVAPGAECTIGLESDGTVVSVGSNVFGQRNVGNWTDIVQVAAGANALGLKSDGTVVAVGWNRFGQCNVGNWTDIIQVAAGGGHTVGLKADGTVVAVGDNEYGQCDVGNWTDIIQVVGGEDTVGLKADGTVVAVGDNEYGQCDVGNWTDIIQVAVGGYRTVGLKSDGTVVAVGGYVSCLLPSSGCFIATAAYGSPIAGEIQILRRFRDEYLLTNPLGHALVDFYYRVSPPIAGFITEHPGLKPVVRAGLLPAVAMSAVVVDTSLAEKIAVIAVLLLASVTFVVWATRRRGRSQAHL